MEPISFKQVLAYWRWYGACELLNDLSVSSHQVLVSPFDLVMGICRDPDLQKKAPCEFWVCVFQIQHLGNIIPCIWLPVSLDTSGNLAPSKEFALPYCPSYLFDPFSPLGGLFGKIEFFHNVLKDLFFENGGLNAQLTWQAYYQKACDLIQYLNANHPCLQDMHAICEQHACFFSKDLTWLNEENYEESSPLAKSLLTTGESQSLPFMDEDQLLPDAHWLCGTMGQNDPLTISQMDIAAHTLHFQNIQAVRTPVGSRAQTLIQTLLATIFIQKNLKNQEFAIGVLSDSLSEKSLEALRLDRKTSLSFIDETAKLLNRPVASEMEAFKLLKNYLEEFVKTYKKNILAAWFAFKGDKHKLSMLRAQRETLQKIDEEHEMLLDKLNGITQKWKEYSMPSFFRNIKFFFFRMAKQERISAFLKTYCADFSFKEHLSIEENISENIRALKVKRAKNHKTLTELSDEIVHLESQQNTWHDLCQQYPQLHTTTQWITAWSQLLTIFGSKLFDGVKLLSSRQGSKTYFDITFYTSSDLKMVKTCNKKFDLLIVTDAHDISLPFAFKLLRQAQRALIFGHQKLTLSYPIVLSDIDTLALKTLVGISTEEMIEDLQYQGKVLSQTSLYYLAEQQSWYKQYDATGLYYDRPLAFQEIWCQTNLAAFYKTYIDRKCIVHPLPGAGLKLFHVVGEVLDKEGWRNPVEADCLITWLKENSSDELAIITLSNSQKIYLEEQCRNISCRVPVYLLKDCPEHHFKTILFSPVYTVQCPRPFLLDCGDAMLYRALTRATETLLIFADTRIFDEKTHSPTGNLAKIIPQDETQSITI